MNTRTLRTAGVLLSLAFLAAACSGSTASEGDEDGDAQAPAATSEASAAPTTEPFDSDDTAPATGEDEGEGEAAPVAEADDDGAAPSRAALSVDEAVAAHGPLDTPWPGPIFTQYACENVPTEHVQAVVAIIPPDERFEFGPDGSCRLSTPSFSLRMTAVGTLDYEQEFVYRQELLRDDEPIAGLGDQAARVMTPSQQAFLILDGDIVWLLEGDGTDVVPPEQFRAFADVLLARFAPSTRIDAEAEPLADEEKARLVALFENWHRAEDGYFDDPSTEAELLRFATQQAATAVVSRRNSNQRQLDGGIGGWTYQVQQLETIDGSWFRGTSRGDVIVAVTCVTVERGQSEGRDPLLSAVTQTLRIVTDGDQWLVDEPVEGAGLSGGTACT